MVASDRPDHHPDSIRPRLNPLHCGAVVASGGPGPASEEAGQSQSPSLRGSGRFTRRPSSKRCKPPVSIPFIAGQWSLLSAGGFPPRRPPCLNPLHCGAVVASKGPGRCRGASHARLNPLHCGAVVASREGGGPRPIHLDVSIPFIAGQWSLLAAIAVRQAARGKSQSPSLRGSGRFRWRWSLPPRSPRSSQSPSLRGSGRFLQARRTRRTRRTCLNPLHCGAVVASARRMAGVGRRGAGLNPLHCGAVVASRTGGGVFPARSKSQSPSLRGSGRFRSARDSATGPGFCLNPLHCGAVVASRARQEAEARARESQSPSLRGSGRFPPPHGGGAKEDHVSIPFIAGQWSLRRGGSAGAAGSAGLNPLHCGAVVASGGALFGFSAGCRVSIPFIAGQWSLPPAARRAGKGGPMSQSPSLRGSGRFRIPAPCGAGSDRVSIPFIAGQWSLRRIRRATRCGSAMSQSPSLRGSGRFWRSAAGCGAMTPPSQSPSLRGSGRFLPRTPPAAPVGLKSQSPSLRGSGRFERPPPHGGWARRSLNPLHCGAVVASPKKVGKVSI